MPGGGSKPPRFDAQGAINTGAQRNLEAATNTEGINTIDANTQYGGLHYGVTTDPITGKQDYTANMQLTPEQQAILDNLQRNQIMGGEQAGELLGSQGFDELYDNPADIIGGANSLTNQAIDKMNPAWERFMAPEREQADTQLRNQGILPGTPAYNLAMDRITNQQQLTKGQWMTEFTPKAFDMAKSNYEEPISIVQKLLGIGGGPADLKNSLPNTPTTSVAPPDVQGAFQSQYNADLQRYQAEQAQRNAIMSAVLGVGKTVMGMPSMPSASSWFNGTSVNPA